jgi:hypothetical protein
MGIAHVIIPNSLARASQDATLCITPTILQKKGIKDKTKLAGCVIIFRNVRSTIIL